MKMPSRTSRWHTQTQVGNECIELKCVRKVWIQVSRMSRNMSIQLMMTIRMAERVNHPMLLAFLE